MIAHFLADLQDELAKEDAWDELALASYADVADADLAPIGIRSARELEPMSSLESR